MALSQHRIVAQGQTPHAHEAQAVEFILKNLPDNEPYRIWALVELIDLSGRRYEIDALIIGYHALYVVEIKNWRGTITGDSVDWTITQADGHTFQRENPHRLANHKAKVLASRLEREFARRGQPGARPRVEPLIFLADEHVSHALRHGGEMAVVTRHDFQRAITRAEYPLVDGRLQHQRIDGPTVKLLRDSLEAIGIKPSQGARRLGELRLGALIGEGPGYQDYLAAHERMPFKRRVRMYVAPASAPSEQRDQVRRAAEREFRTLTVLADHPAILRAHDFVSDGPTGAPCVVFDHHDEAQPLDAFLRANPTLSLAERVRILQLVGEALAYCHRKKVAHRALHPGAILVRRRTDADKESALEVRLCDFQLAAHEDSAPATLHVTSLTGDPALLYRAPEALENPALLRELADVFSLGCVAYFVFTGQHPASDLGARQELLRRVGRLSVAAVRDDLTGVVPSRLAELLAKDDASYSIDDVVGMATDLDPTGRPDAVIDWVNILLETATAPPVPQAPATDPLEAAPGDVLRARDGDLLVERVLGTGSTARVLRVSRDRDGEMALKIALSPAQDARLDIEADVLSQLNSDRIVRLIEREPIVIAGRRCLLLTDAGVTLAGLLTTQGTISIDYARRFGEDLLLALQSLEEAGIQHRDIKPGNLGVAGRAGKKALHLILFDFSLSGTTPPPTTSGTPMYRDPFVHSRGWDTAADRYSAAVTLHEMLTGALPTWGDGRASATLPSAALVIAAERFDASVRARLVPFFERALSREVAARHPTAEAMRTDWVACFAAGASVVTTAVAATPRVAGEDDPTPPPLDDADEPAPPDSELAHATVETPIAALTLSNRARNALDRASVLTVADMLRVPPKSFPALRGIGGKTAREIQRYVAALQRVQPGLVVPSSEPFFPGFAGASTPVAFVTGLDPRAAAVLDDADLGHLALAAGASRARVERLVGAYAGAIDVLRQALERAGTAAASAPAPTPGEDAARTIEWWIDALVPPAKGRGAKPRQQVRLLLGLEPPPPARPGREAKPLVTAADVADALGVTRQAVSAALGEERSRWSEHPELARLHEAVAGVLTALGGVASFRRLAELLPRTLPHAPGRDAEPDARARAAALVRIAGETAWNLVFGRVNDGPWLAASGDHLDVARALGDEADRLAAREPLPASDEVLVALGARAASTPLAALPPDRLTALAADASRTAARSARLELYPRGMAATRALTLAAGALAQGRLTEEDIRRVVTARYPEAEAMPTGEPLAALLERFGLRWSEAAHAFQRPGAAAVDLPPTQAVSSRRSTAQGWIARPRTPETSVADEFDKHVRLAAERRAFRVLEVPAPDAAQTARGLEKRLKTRAVSLDAELWREARAQMAAAHVELGAVVDADRAGPSGPHWPRLRALMQGAADAVATRLEQERGTLILTDPGLLARYRLDSFLARMLEASTRDDGPAVFLVVPAQDDPGPAPIDGMFGPLSIPTASPGQRLPVPRAWITNEYRGGAA